MLYEGKDPATASLDDAIATTDTLAKLVKDGQVRQVYGNDYIDALINGDLAIALAWSGDIIVNQVDSPQLEFAFPDEGVMIWTDNMLIPKGAANKANAEAWMNFYYDPAVAARLSYYVQYVSPVQGAKEAMLEIDADVANDPTVFPDQTILDKAHIFRSLTEDEETQLNEAVAKATGV
jgi:spermidine/putrescine transport system substrate-binding protein